MAEGRCLSRPPLFLSLMIEIPMQILRTVVRSAWRRREPVFWVLLVAIAVGAQWPVLKGWYYRGAGTTAPTSGISWRTNLSSALGEARASHKLVLVEFSAGWCPPCALMKHEVWPDAKVVASVNAAFVPVTVDVDTDNGLSDRYDVPAIPAVLVLDGNGRVVRRHDGYLPLDGMLQFLAGRPAR